MINSDMVRIRKGTPLTMLKGVIGVIMCVSQIQRECAVTPVKMQIPK